MTDILILGDPWDTLDLPRDSSLHLADIAHNEFGIHSYWALPGSVFANNGELTVRLLGQVVDLKLQPLENSIRSLDSFHSIHWRVDPPVDLSTMRLWSLLGATQASKHLFINSPQALLVWNEKFAPMHFADWAIPGLVSDSENEWQSFFESNKSKRLVAKPTGEAASRGVQMLSSNWESAKAELHDLRHQHGSWLVIQEFEEALLKEGETRVFVVNAEIAGAINKRPSPKYPIMNLDAPESERPKLVLAKPTAEQSRRALEIAKYLAKDGVYLATIDFIGERILEINVTSPGLIRWLDGQMPKKNSLALKYWADLIARKPL